MFLRFARLLSHAQVVPQLRTHSVHPTHDLLHVSEVFIQQFANPHVIHVGWVWGEGGIVNVCIHGQSVKGVQVQGESLSPARAVVKVLGIRILHLANSQCGRRRMVFMAGSGRSRNYSVREKTKPHWTLFFV